MHSLKIDFRYLPDKSHEYYRQEGNIEPSAYAMHWCMLATNVNRIFSTEDIKEFVYRMAIILVSDEMIERWLETHEFFSFIYKGQDFTFKMEDLISYFGLEIVDHIDNMANRNYFKKNIGKSVRQAIFIGDQEQLKIKSPVGLEIFELIKDKDNHISKEEKVKYEDFVLNKKRESLAAFLAQDVMKFIPDSLFYASHPAIETKKEELCKRKERINSLPVFSFQKLSKKKLHLCLHTMFNKEYVCEIENDAEELERVAKPLIYLAWLYANDLLVFEDWDYFPVEGVELRLEDYMDENDSFLLKQSIDDYFLEDLKPVLKGFY